MRIARLMASTLASAVAVMAALGGVAAAQGTTGSISGFVTDTTSAALPGATVTVRQVETDQKRVVVTDAAGRYRVQALAPGKYELTVELQGFRTAQYPSLSLSVGQDAAVNIQMQLGGLDER